MSIRPGPDYHLRAVPQPIKRNETRPRFLRYGVRAFPPARWVPPICFLSRFQTPERARAAKSRSLAAVTATRLPDGAAARVLPSSPPPRAPAATSTTTTTTTGSPSFTRAPRHSRPRPALLEALLVGLGGGGRRAPRGPRLWPRRLGVLGLDSRGDRVGPGAHAAA